MCEGGNVGFAVGRGDGSIVGLCDRVGLAVGSGEGPCVGSAVGSWLGRRLTVGKRVGALLGRSVGRGEGHRKLGAKDTVGACDGRLLVEGTSDGGVVGSRLIEDAVVGCSVGAGVTACVARATSTISTMGEKFIRFAQPMAATKYIPPTTTRRDAV